MFCLLAEPIAAFQAGVVEAEVDYTLDMVYVNLDTASQMWWATLAQKTLAQQVEGQVLADESTLLDQELPRENEQTEQSSYYAAETSWFAFMQVVHATPQSSSRLHYLMVRVFAKEVDNVVAPALVVVQRKHNLYEQALDRILFAFQVLNMGFVMTPKNKVLVGACVHGITDAFTLFIFDMDMDFVSVSEFTDCVACCETPTPNNSKAVHAHLDPVMRNLYVFTDTHLYTAIMDKTVRHQQQEDYEPISLRGGVLLPAFFRQAGRRILQISSAYQLPFVLFTTTDPQHDASAFAEQAQNWHSFHVLTESGAAADMGTLRILYGVQAADFNLGSRSTGSMHDVAVGVSQSADSIVYTPYFGSAEVLEEVMLQIKKRHDPGADTTLEGGFREMKMQSFSVLNNQKRSTIPNPRRFVEQSHIVHLLVSHGQTPSAILLQEEDVMHDQVISLVTVNVSTNGVSTILVHLMRIVTHEQRNTMHSFFYSVIPYDVDGSAENNIIAKGLVAIIVQRGNSHSVQLSNFSCLQCGSDLYDPLTESCQCRPGTLPVCLPCATNCAVGRFVVDPDPTRCQRADLITSVDSTVILSGTRRQRHNLVCMPCSGAFFCTNGTVDSLAQCPVERPLTLARAARADFQCVCPAGSSFDTDLAVSYMVNGATVARVPQLVSTNRSMCAQCTERELCSPIYTQKSHRILCPAHTTSSTLQVLAGGIRPSAWLRTELENTDDELYHNTYQGCFCDNGYYRIGHRSESYLSDSADFIYQYVWANPILAKYSTAGNTRLHIRIETCRECEAGWACQDSSRRQCVEESSTSQPGSAVCTCRPGYVKIDNTTCGSCPRDSFCMGGTIPAKPCTSVAFSPRTVDTQFCPCPSGSIRNALSHMCETCSAGFFCPGFDNMTGVVPSDTIYARRCPINSTSLPGAQSLQSCFCTSGFFISTLARLPACIPCRAGYYCPGTSGPPKKCPLYTTTTQSHTPATTVSDCHCMNPDMQLDSKLDSDNLDHKCVCRAGWLHVRYIL